MFPRRFQRPIMLLAAALPPLAYALLVVRNAVNIPVWDDFDSILFMLAHPDYDYSLFVFRNEHRLVFTRLVALGYHALTGHINFEHLIYLGNLGLFGLFALLARIHRDRGHSLWLFLPIPCLLFLPQSWENMTWAMASLQNYWSLLFVLGALYLWNRGTTPAHVGAAVLASCGGLTSGNGILVFPLLALWQGLRMVATLREPEPPFARRRREAITLGAISVYGAAYILLYVWGYTKPPHHPAIAESLAQPVKLAQYIVFFLGGWFPYAGRKAAFAAGLLVLAGLGYVGARRLHARAPLVFFYMAFLVLSIVPAALGRLNFGVDQAMEPRYRIVTLNILIGLYWGLLALHPGFFARVRNAGAVLVLAAGLFLTSMIVDTRELARIRHTLTEGMARWPATGEGLYYPNQELAADYLRHALAKGIYLPPGPEGR